MRIRWCDYCGTTKDVIHTIEIRDNLYDFCEYCYERLNNDLKRKKEQNRKNYRNDEE